MSPSDEQKKAAFKAMEGHFGKDTPAFIECFMKAGADEGVYGDDVYDCMIQFSTFIENFKCSVGEKAYPAASTALLLVILQYLADTDPRKNKK
ncbi:hypothetical protein ACLOAV_002863 [Pseudogymnoascus australis]